MRGYPRRMVRIGYVVSCGEFGPNELVQQTRDTGFERLWISGHCHPWNGEQGQIPFVGSVIGASSKAVDVIRALREGGSRSHHGEYYTVENARADLLAACREAGGKGPAQGGFKVRHAPIVEEGLDTVYRIWPNEGLPGELAQVLPRREHFEQASTHATHDVLSLPDPEPYAAPFANAGFDEVYVAQIGPRQDELVRFWREEITPRL